MYRRFLNDSDYLSIATKEMMSQLTRDNRDRLPMAEEYAEASITEYLSNAYEIERELETGRRLLEYSPAVTYPMGVHFYLDGKIYATTRPIKGYKAPYTKPYWEPCDDPGMKDVTPYTQTASYAPGDVVMFNGSIFMCLEYNGRAYGDIRIPGLFAWTEAPFDEWAPNVTYEVGQAVRYNRRFYMLMTHEGLDQTVDPHTSGNWGLVGEYTPEYNMYNLEGRDYVEYGSRLFLPVMDPNHDEPREGFNITPDDPRNPNIKKHMVRLALYELYKLTAPTNISQSRITDYETSVMWLRDAARMRISPGIPRKIDCDRKPVTDYAVATYARDYDPYKNPWQI